MRVLRGGPGRPGPIAGNEGAPRASAARGALVGGDARGTRARRRARGVGPRDAPLREGGELPGEGGGDGVGGTPWWRTGGRRLLDHEAWARDAASFLAWHHFTPRFCATLEACL